MTRRRWPRVSHAVLAAAMGAAVVVAGVRLGHAIDPTWRTRHAPLGRDLPFRMPDIVFVDEAGRAVRTDAFAGRASLLDIALPGCARQADAEQAIAQIERALRLDRVDDFALVTVAVDDGPGSADALRRAYAADPRRRVLTVDAGAWPMFSAGMGLPAGEGGRRLTALAWPHFFYVVDGEGMVRAAFDAWQPGAAARAAAALVSVVRSLPQPAFATRAKPAASSPLPIAPRKVAPFVAVDQDGRQVSAREFAGMTWVADLIFTRCTMSCPLLSAKLAALRRAAADPRLRFVSFTVDPENDTPTVLKAYAARWGAPDSRWRLLRMERAQLRTVAASLGLYADENGGALLHSDRFVLVGPDGFVRGRFASADGRDVAALADALGAASDSAPSPPATAPEGARLYAALGCGGCHANPAVAPPLGGMANREITLQDGSRRIADDVYLRESIATPGAAVVAGFRATMPDYGPFLRAAEIDALVDYLKALPASAGSGAPSLAAIN